MIGLDTNVLVRYLVKDDPSQTPHAVKLVHSLTPHAPGWIGLTVVVELAWVLMRTYRDKTDGLVKILETLLASEDVVIEQAQTVRRALLMYRHGKADYPDCLISVSAKVHGCHRVVTFDRIAARDAGMELIG